MKPGAGTRTTTSLDRHLVARLQKSQINPRVVEAVREITIDQVALIGTRGGWAALSFTCLGNHPGNWCLTKLYHNFGLARLSTAVTNPPIKKCTVHSFQCKRFLFPRGLQSCLFIFLERSERCCALVKSSVNGLFGT